jgi:hypothetical protein
VGTNAGFNNPFGVCVDTIGNVYVADFVNNRIRRITPSGVVTTLAGSGTSTFVDGVGTNASFSSPNGLFMDMTGNMYVADSATHRIRKISTLYSQTLSVDVNTTPNNTAAFTVKYNSFGTSLWSVTYDGAANDAAMTISTDTVQNVYVSGYYGSNMLTAYHNTTPAPLTPLPATANTAAFCSKIDRDGSVQWYARIEGPSPEQALGSGVDTSGNLYITGSYGPSEATLFHANNSNSGIVLPAVSNIGAFLVKYDTLGTVQWANTIRGVSSNIGYSISIDGSDNVYVGGTYQGQTSPVITMPSNMPSTLSLPAPTGNSGSNTGGFVIRYNSAGTPQSAWAIAGLSNASIYSVSVDGTGSNLALSGFFTSGSNNTLLYSDEGIPSSITFPTAVTTQSAYVARYSPIIPAATLVSSASNGQQKYITNIGTSNIALNIMNSNGSVVTNSFTLNPGSNFMFQFFGGNWYKFM